MVFGLDFSKSEGSKQRGHQNQFIYRAQHKLDPERLFSQYQGLYGLFGPQMEQQISNMQRQIGLASGQAANTAQAGLGRAGLGGTGLGAALGAGLTQGGNLAGILGGNQIRDRLQADLRNAAFGQRMAEFNMFAGLAGGVDTSGGQFSAGGQLLGSAGQSALNAIPFSPGTQKQQGSSTYGSNYPGVMG